MQTVQALRRAASTLNTHDRPLQLALALAEGTRDDLLLPQKMVGKEAICAGFTYRVLCVAEHAALPLKNFIGVPAQVRIVTDRGELRRICGIVTEAASGQSDGALATYQLVLRDALSVMEGSRNTRVFRNRSELDVVRTLVTEWHERNGVLRETFELHVDVGVDEAVVPREFIMQHNESDASFIKRLLSRRGIAWYFRSGLGDNTAPHREPDLIAHTLVLFKDTGQLCQNAAGTVRFHRDEATEQRDAVTAWNAVRILQPGSASLHSWDYKNASAGHFMHASTRTRAEQGGRGNELAAGLDDYVIAAPHIGDSIGDLTGLADIRMAYHEYEVKAFQGEGGVRDLAVGEWFSLTGHPEIDTHPAHEREFVITAQDIATQNNLPVEIGPRVERLFRRSGWHSGDYAAFAGDDGKPLRYKTRFACVRRGIRIVAPPQSLPRPALQSAVVVGPAQEEVWCDELGRVKIRFPGTRPQDHERANGAGSSDTDTDSAWVRVASSWAGNGFGSATQCGTRLLPPVGTEVLVDFAGGDPDKPVIIGQVYNGTGPPPAFHREDALPRTKYQSGIRSREVRGKRGNQLRLDDTPGQISAQLASDHGSTELNLGYLTEPRHDGSAAPRGEGVELRSDAAIALHAVKGILLSTWALLGGTGRKGKQLARDDFLTLLRESSELCASLGNYAVEHNGTAPDTKALDDLLQRFKQWEHGSNTAPEAAESAAPVIGVTSPAGIGFATSEAIVSYAARNIDSVAQQHLQMTAGQRCTLNAGQGIALFAQNGGLTGVAHRGKLLLQSQHDDTEINAAKDLTLTSTEGTATISAKVILLVAEDGSFLRLGDGPPVIGSKQPLKFHASDFLYEAPETMAAVSPSFAKGGADQKLVVRYAPGTLLDNGDRPVGAAVKDARIDLSLSDGSTAQARTGSDGKSELVERATMHMVDVGLLRGGEA
ncbi:type VI secretion system tip protein VgrG [Pseudoduganella armeniaca]|uniref:Type VI secretion system tip protein VgrG n=2 Tax=Pseudoduganella armeniaca TaxID=2072590 RepID=A0A2R4C4Q7_9BURK|nr:type VI secretion system tip protein VgrG [Pseudoduganella armeniaca]